MIIVVNFPPEFQEVLSLQLFEGTQRIKTHRWSFSQQSPPAVLLVRGYCFSCESASFHQRARHPGTTASSVSTWALCIFTSPPGVSDQLRDNLFKKMLFNCLFWSKMELNIFMYSTTTQNCKHKRCVFGKRSMNSLRNVHITQHSSYTFSNLFNYLCVSVCTACAPRREAVFLTAAAQDSNPTCGSLLSSSFSLSPLSCQLFSYPFIERHENPWIIIIISVKNYFVFQRSNIYTIVW